MFHYMDVNGHCPSLTLMPQTSLLLKVKVNAISGAVENVLLFHIIITEGHMIYIQCIPGIQMQKQQFQSSFDSTVRMSGHAFLHEIKPNHTVSGHLVTILYVGQQCVLVLSAWTCNNMWF